MDEFFKDGLAESDLEMPKADWLAMKKILNNQQGKNQAKSLLYVWISGIAAMLAIAFFLFKSDLQPTSEKITKKRNDTLRNTKTEEQTVVNTPKNNPESATKTLSESVIVSGLSAVNSKSAGQKTVKLAHKVLQSTPAKELYVATNNESTTLLKEKDTAVNDQKKVMLILDDTVKQEPALVNSLTVKSELLVEGNKPTLPSKPLLAKEKYRKGLVLSLSAGSDLNAVGSFKDAGFGTNAGLLATWQFSRKFSMTTGIVYAKKLYDSDYGNYKPTVSYGNSYNPTGISADCRVLDIPLNINYKVWNNKKGGIVFTGGASSYLMLKEKYDFLYAGYTRPITYNGENQHYLGVLNFAFAYERITSSKTSISLQPYVKIPVTGIGQGNVNLVSTGLSLNLNLNLKKKHD